MDPSFSLVAVVIGGLVNWQIVEVWRHSSLTAEFRARIETWREGTLRNLLLCPFCLSHWTGLLVAIWLGVAGHRPKFGESTPGYVELMLHTFAIVRVSQLLNDVFHSVTRTPRN